MNVLQSSKQLFAVTLALALAAQGAAAQTVGANLSQFNILANPSVTLTGFAAQPLYVPVVGTSPGITLTTTRATVGTYHPNDALAINGESEASALWNSLTAPVGATIRAANFGTNPNAGTFIAGPLNPLPTLGGITVYQIAAALSTTGGLPTQIDGDANTIVIFQVTTDLTNTNHDFVLSGGMKAENIYWQVTDAASITNNDATPRGFPGTIVNKTNARDITVVSSGAGALKVGKLFSVGGSVSITQSGAGAMTFDFGPSVASPTGSNCTAGNFFPSPATGRVGTFNYCMGSAGSVKIKVWNAIGDLASEIEESKPAGLQTSTMDTARLAPGVYLYTVERNYDSGASIKSGIKKFVVKH